MNPAKLPRRFVVHIDFGSGPKHLTASYTAPADIIARFAPALRQWNPDYRVEIEPIDPDAENLPPGLPTWRLFAWDEPDPLC
ncbi:hypothetical protein LTV02_10805 [Nocardia yamanashiensis]|uniref:hypothetical protein n=1 Tax=Nocardia yamanashiensis TaxID=209247 RepID=UPI001E4E99A1|nr:hypothetical protein [Nocardia yamanashiensis]UGT43838.1 hypothetical protein LTV02_10805 [Nocardia yamanashiensis]